MANLASARRGASEVNVGPMQRGASVLGGGALVAVGLKRRTPGGTVLALAGADLLYRGVTGYCHVLGALGIDTSSGDSGGNPGADAVEIRRSITIRQPRDEVYRRWRDPQSQPLVWSHVAEVTNATDDGAHWRVAAPLGRTFEWDTRLVDDQEGRLIRWESTSGDLRNAGTVEFRDAPGDFGTEVTLDVRLEPPAGRLGEAALRLLDEPPKLVVEKALRRFKSLVEAGEIASTERNPSGRTS